MKQYLLFVILFSSFSLFGQEKLMFDITKIDSTTKLIGRYPLYDKQKTHKSLNFIVEDVETIKAMIKALPLGSEDDNIVEDPGFEIALIRNYVEEKSWSVNPSFNSVRNGGKTFSFDIKRLKKLSKKYPFDYKFEMIAFKDKAVYDSFLNKQRLDKSFLFSYDPPFGALEGSFELEFPRNDPFSSPKAISEYLRPIIEKLVSSDQYSVSYSLNEKNMQNQTQFTMTIAGSKKLYNDLQLEGFKKGEWQPIVKQGYFFYKVD